MRLRDVLHDAYSPLKALSEKSVANYLSTIKAFARFLGREPTLEDLDELTVARYLSHRGKERAIATAAKDRSQLRALHEFSVRRGLCAHWPQYPPVRVPERVPQAWLSSEMRRLLDAAMAETKPVGDIPGGLFWRALIMLAYDSAERATALLSLRWRDVRGSHVVFTAETRKGCRRDVLREIGEDTREAMGAIRMSRGDDDLVFPWPLTQTYIWSRLERILKRAGLPHGRRDKFHRIRRTTASYYAAAGGSAQILLDHSSPATTRKYLDPRIVAGVSAASVIPRLTQSSEEPESEP